MFLKWLARLNESQIWQRPVVVRGMKFVPPTLDRWVALQGHRLGLMGTAEFNFFEKFVSPNSHIADVGANQGICTLALSRKANDGKVYAFEPDPWLFDALKKNVEGNAAQNVLLFNAAAASRRSTLALRPSRFNRGDNRILQSNSASAHTIRVEAIPLDETIPEHRVDLLKIDVQGYETAVLKGAQQVLRSNSDLLILFEFWPHGLRLSGSSPEELVDLFRATGFSLVGFDDNLSFQPFVYEPQSWSRAYQFCNLVAVRNPATLTGSLSLS